MSDHRSYLRRLEKLETGFPPRGRGAWVPPRIRIPGGPALVWWHALPRRPGDTRPDRLVLPTRDGRYFNADGSLKEGVEVEHE